MIVIDKSEDSHLPKMSNIFVSDKLEEETGADIMVSCVSIPPSTPALMKKHIENNALLIQRKSGLDLVSSLGDRLNLSLIKMRETGASQSQCVLLFVGKIEFDLSGFAFVNNKQVDVTYINLISAISHWCDRGGVYINIENEDLIAPYLRKREDDLLKYRDNPVKEIFPQPEFPLQETVKVDDWRLTIATFPMMGIKRTNELRDSMIRANTSDDLLTAISWLTDTRRSPNLKGMGKVVRDASRSWMGIPNGWNIDLTPEQNEED